MGNKAMFGTLKNERGTTLIEIIVVMLISTLLILVSAIAISAFFRRYKVINSFIDLQKGALECISTIRDGYPMNRGEQFYGVANARSMQITGTSDSWNAGSGIKIFPPIYADFQNNDMVHFYLESGVIKVNYIYNGIQVNTPQHLFPTRDMQDVMQVTRFTVADANATGSILPLSEVVDTELRIIEINMEARVKVKDAPLPNQIEYKTINYRTYMVRK